MTALIKVLAALVTAMLVAGAGATLIGPMLEQSETREIAMPSGIDELVLKNDAGDVTVREAAEGEEPSITVVETWGLRRLPVTVTSAGGTATLDAGCPNVSFNVCETDWTVVVPTGTAVDISNGFGAVELAGLSGDTEVLHGIGSIELVGSRAENVHTEVGVGSVSIDAAVAPRATRVSSGVGDVSLTLPGQERYRVDVTGAPSGVTNALGDDPSAEHRVDIEYGMGAVDIRPR